MVLAKDIPGILKKHFQIERVEVDNAVQFSSFINNKYFVCLFGVCSMFYTHTFHYTTTEREPSHRFTLYIL